MCLVIASVEKGVVDRLAIFKRHNAQDARFGFTWQGNVALETNAAILDLHRAADSAGQNGTTQFDS